MPLGIQKEQKKSEKKRETSVQHPIRPHAVAQAAGGVGDKGRVRIAAQ